MDKTESLRVIKEEVIGLKDSPLYKERIENGVFPVIGEGNHDARVMFVGEAPGAREAATGRPFCGRAGNILTECLFSIGFRREDAYITNIVKDRPPKNRDPRPEEIEIYSPFLDRQINIIKPEILVPLGRFSAEYIMRKFGLEKEIEPITVMHGRCFEARADFGELKITPIMHPAVAVHDPRKRELLESGFHSLKDNLKQ